jgi:glycosyltransferase involved in cell wall biosynthesis
MKILQVSSFMPPHQGGLELVVDNLVKGLRERSYEVRWIASSPPLTPGCEGGQIRVPAFKALEELLHVPLPFWGITGYRELYKQCVWADVVHAHDCLYPSSIGAILFARWLNKRSVITQHIADVPYSRVLAWIQVTAYRTIGRFILNSADAIAAYSAHIPPYFKRLGLRKAIDLIPIGFDARFHPCSRDQRNSLRQKYCINSNDPVVLFVGRLVPKKGVEDVVAVQKQLAQRGCTLVVAGDGALAPLIQPAPRTLHLRHIPYSAMHELYGLADVLFLPSHGEGLPLSLQEALLCGLPAVVSQDPSYVSNVADAPGVSLGEGVNDWVNAIRCSLAGEISPKEISLWANLHFSRSRFLDEYEKLYQKLYSASA